MLQITRCSLLLLFVLSCWGCEGVLDQGMEKPDDLNNGTQNNHTTNNANNGNNGSGSNNGNNGNNGTPDMAVDLPPGDPCIGVTCGANAACADGACSCASGFVGDPVAGCTPADPCASTNCAYGATCNQGTCYCDAGFNDDGAGGCDQITPGATASRTKQEVCDKWTADHPRQASTKWQVEPVDECDPGVLHPEVQTDALRRVSLYRWLVGLPAVTSDAAKVTMNQACATVLAAQNAGLTHTIPETYACYTPLAAQGAGSSNIAQGVSNPADSVGLYIGDRGVPSLGHRRWIFNPGMGKTGFGQRDAYSCMYSFDGSSGANPDYVAYPAPGPFPNVALSGAWSFGSTKYGLTNATVAITKVSDGSDVPATNPYVPTGNYGIKVLAWGVANPEIDEEYEITISGLTGAVTEVTYRTTLVTCN